MGTSQGLDLTVPAIAEPRENHCRECGKKLGLFKRLAKAEFCDDSHRASYAQKQNEMVLARLHASERPQENKTSPPEPTPHPAAARGTAAA